jgi:hypothetical protein
MNMLLLNLKGLALTFKNLRYRLPVKLSMRLRFAFFGLKI